MYCASNLIVYCEKGILQNHIHAMIAKCDITFKQINSTSLMFLALKNPKNYAIFAIDNPKSLHEVELMSKNCYDAQNRIFIAFSSKTLCDNFFKNHCLSSNLRPLTDFINNNVKQNNILSNNQSSTLLEKLIKLELENLEIPTKYIGFKYLVEILSNALTKNFYNSNYIDLFEHVASKHFSTIDTIERDVRHMLVTTWKNNIDFRNKLEKNNPIIKPNAKNILNAVILYLKNII